VENASFLLHIKALGDPTPSHARQVVCLPHAGPILWPTLRMSKSAPHEMSIVLGHGTVNLTNI
jgi:hypothetical protein